ncbi:MAG: hypothetical protein WDZ30_04720 [Cellvibrionaceae bacterium]
MQLRRLIFPLALVCSPVVFGANDGTLGSTSTGDTDVSVTIGDLVQVLVEGDISLTYTPGSNSTGTAGLCIYRNGSSSVDLTLSSANQDAGAFQMISGTDLLPYAVALSGDDTVGSIASGTGNTLTGANTTSSNCGGAGNFGHDIDVTVQGTDLDAAPAGTYVDTITILVEPV